MSDPTSQLRSATRRAKSDVANKLVSMFLHELSRRASQDWTIRIESEEYGSLVREYFGNRCPYCAGELSEGSTIIEHLDGMNRYRVGLHIPGNVLVACRRCNSEKRRDDSLQNLVLANSGWASFLSHDGSRCSPSCATCKYWKAVWPDDSERPRRLQQNRMRVESFRSRFSQAELLRTEISEALPVLLSKLYVDCQEFAEREIAALLERFEQLRNSRTALPATQN